MVANAPPKVSIVGITNKEAATFTTLAIASVVHDFHKLHIKPEDYSKWDREKLIGELKKLIEQVYSGEHLQEIISDVVARYVDREDQKSFAFYIDRYTEFISDLLFNAPAVEGILARRDAGWDMYVYLLDHYNDAIWDSKVPKEMRGAPHASETPYVSDVFILKKFEFNEDERAVAEVFQQSFTEFVKIGAPSNHHEVWLEVGARSDLRYLRIAPYPELQQGFYNETVNFWRKIRNYGFDMVQLLPTRKPSAEIKEEL
ncbi:unnamed protein product [Strongylus vulgaris]|uniref:Carboxylesterase type B domain-containing protein n=1 Tax=Strongylus vulgaris TaxID=40348 RepID=A0A3P7J2C2_STRVU|nr:unnamed protein product [Strongylus vulgaris]